MTVQLVELKPIAVFSDLSLMLQETTLPVGKKKEKKRLPLPGRSPLTLYIHALKAI